MSNVEALERYGLQKVGTWTKSEHASVAHLRERCETGIQFEVPEDWRKRQNVTYAFVVELRVMYIGETTRGMASRFEGYRYGNNYESDTDNRVKLALTSALVKGQPVEIWASEPVALFALQDGSIENLPASKPVEERLILEIKPDLNLKNIGKKNDSG